MGMSGTEEPDLRAFDLSDIREPNDGVLYLFRSSVDGFWHLDSDEDMALQEATGYPAGELQEYEAMGDHEAAEYGDLLAVFVSAGKWRDNRTLHTGTDRSGDGDQS
jgi:hypothetical protein